MAQNIWDDALHHTLQNPGRLDGYLAQDPDSINKVGGEAVLTPLAAACHEGYLDVVTLLIAKGARPNVPCPHGRTALYYAITQAPQKNKSSIVKALLTASDGKADPNEVYPEDGNQNALAIAILESRDSDAVQALVEAGANPTPENKQQAKDMKMERSLLPWAKMTESFVDLAASAVSLIISYTDGGFINAVAKGALKKMYKITSAKNNPVAAVIAEPKSAEDFKKNITNFVQSTGLDKFFAKKPDFLQALAEKAAALRNDTTTDLGKPENLERLTHLTLYQLVIYCDDSGSMDATDGDPRTTRLQTQRQLVSRITKIATKLLRDDAVVKVRFINNSFNNDVTASGVDAIMANVDTSGSTPLGNNLVEKIIQPLVYDKISNPKFEFEQPLLVCVITDGSPDGGDLPIQQVVSNCKTALVAKKYDPASVMFCISQIGADSYATAFLDSLRQDDQIEDVVYCTTDQLDAKFMELKEQERELEVWLLDMLTKPIMRNFSGSPSP